MNLYKLYVSVLNYIELFILLLQNLFYYSLQLFISYFIRFLCVVVVAVVVAVVVIVVYQLNCSCLTQVCHIIIITQLHGNKLG